MRRPVQRAVELALGAAAAALLVLLVLPWREAPLPHAADSGGPAPASREGTPPESGSVVPPEAILRLFTGAKPVAAETQVGPPVVKPVDAPWLRYMGRSSAPDGTAHVYVKDTKSGKVIMASRGMALDGWILVAEDADTLTLANGGDVYSVSKR
jgi:hypothetical protein